MNDLPVSERDRLCEVGHVAARLCGANVVLLWTAHDWKEAYSVVLQDIPLDPGKVSIVLRAHGHGWLATDSQIN